MTNRPICPGTGKAVPIPANEALDARRFANCDHCGTRLELHLGAIPKHRLRAKPRELRREATCLVPGCENQRLGVCAEHAEESG